MCLSIKIRNPSAVLSEGKHLGLEWTVTHNGIGFRCGYVRIPKGHPWHGKSYDEINARVHGGLTFSEPDVPCDKGGADDAWWLGFDCSHHGDARDPSLNMTPMRAIFKNYPQFAGEKIRTTAYVKAECRRLCKQAVTARGRNGS